MSSVSNSVYAHNFNSHNLIIAPILSCLDHLLHRLRTMDAICSISTFLWSNLAVGLLIIIFLGLQNSFYSENSYTASVFVRTEKTRPLHAFNAIRHRWQHTCESQNVVLPRGDNIAIDMTSERHWSLHGDAFQEGEQHSVTACQSMEDLLAAIKYGERKWNGQAEQGKEPRPVNVSTSYEHSPSFFVPKGCHINYLTAKQSCDILNKYSTVIVAGDSLGRHTAQGLMMILSEDFVTGSYPRGTGLSRDMYDHCRCDGQFSENASCRAFDVLRLLPEDPRDYGLCTHIKGPIFKLQYTTLAAPEEAETSPMWQSLCVVRDDRPILLVLNAGAHYGSDPDLTLSQFIHVVHQKLLEANAACEWDLVFRILWTGLNAQSRQLDNLYPHQSREKAATFNHIVETNIPPSYEMTILDFWNLTCDATTSDGYHYLSDVNIYKATTIVHAASLFHAVEVP